MRKLIPLLFVLCLPFISSGQKMNAKEKAKAILEQVTKEYNQYNTIEAKFSYTLENKKRENFKEVEEGKIKLKGNKFRINLGSYLVICDSENVWTYLKDAKEVQINDYKPGEMKINPKEMFTIYKEGFLYGYKGRNTIDGKSMHTIELTPENKEKSYYKVRLQVEPKTYKIRKTKIFEKDGSIFTYDIKSYNINKALPDKQFEFKKQNYPNVTVVDLRK